jgi:hypothetical protein
MLASVDNLGIPPLAGVCSYERAATPGVGVDATVARLKRLNYVLGRLHQIGAAQLARTPEWEVKCGLGLHLWLDSEHCAALRARVGEMREPPLHLDDVPDERLRAAPEELLRAQDSAELVTGIRRPAPGAPGRGACAPRVHESPLRPSHVSPAASGRALSRRRCWSGVTRRARH